MSGPVRIIDRFGNPMSSQRSRAQMLANDSNVPYDAADMHGEHMAAWSPFLWSPDAEFNIYRDRIVSRVRDVARNDGWAAGGITRILDNAIGANFRPISKPDYRALAAATGIKSFDAQWADEYGRVADGAYRSWANDPGRYCDASRSMIVPQIYYVAFRHKLVDGDALAVMQWLPDRIRPGRAAYATAVHLIDPDRLSNPQMRFDTLHERGGVVVDEFGAATGYNIRRAHMGDWWAAQDAVTWDTIPRETDWGRPIVVHDFDRERAGQHRGGKGILTPVLQRLKMLIKYDSSELDSAIINAIFAAYIESPFDHSLIEEALGGSDELSAYQAGRAEFHKERRITINGARVPTLYPNEKMVAINAARPNSNFRDFEGAVLRNVASGMGISAQQLSQDWSDVNYSSARAALLEAWKTMARRRTDFAVGFSHPVYCCFLEESMDRNAYPLPNGAPEFFEHRAAYGACLWLGPGRGWVDPVAEKQGAVLGLDAGFSTLEAECAEQGLDYEEVLDQRQIERQAFIKRDLPFPVWQGQAQSTDEDKAKPADATEASKKPQKPTAAGATSHVINVAAPVVNVAPPVVNVSVPVANHIPKRGGEKTTVTAHDERGRIKEFERREIEE